jgi:hypothetical protein
VTVASDFALLIVGGECAFYPTSGSESPSNIEIHQEWEIRERIPTALQTIRPGCRGLAAMQCLCHTGDR